MKSAFYYLIGLIVEAYCMALDEADRVQAEEAKR